MEEVESIDKCSKHLSLSDLVGKIFQIFNSKDWFAVRPAARQSNFIDSTVKEPDRIAEFFR